LAEDVPLWAKKLLKEVNNLTEQTKTNCNKLNKLDVKVNNLPIKIKQDLLPQLIREVRNSVRSELDKKF